MEQTKQHLTVQDLSGYGFRINTVKTAHNKSYGICYSLEGVDLWHSVIEKKIFFNPYESSGVTLKTHKQLLGLIALYNL